MKNKQIFYWSSFFLILMLIPVSNHSIWVDESMTAFMASQSTFSALYSNVISTHLSEAQMPGYLVYMWGWVKVFGFSEVSLRLANVPFLFLFVLLVLYAPMDKRMKLLIASITCFSPIIWFYLNEARYVILVFSVSGICISSIIYYFNGGLKQKKFGIVLFTVSTIVGISFNMLFLFFLLPITAFALLLAFRTDTDLKVMIREWLISISVIAIFCISWLMYYVWTVQKGAGGVVETPGIGNIAFTLYEFFGFLGIGPPRDVLRENQSVQLIMNYLPLLSLLSIAYLALFGLTVYRFRGSLQKLVLNPYLISFVVGFATFVIIAYAFHFRFWARHLIFIYPFLIFYISEVIVHSISNFRGVKAYFLIAAVFLILFGISNFNIRFSEAYQKENDRLAVTTASQFAGNEKEIIWITYGGFCAQYYGLRNKGKNYDLPESWPHTRDVELIIARDPQELKKILESYSRKGAVIVFFNKSLDYDSNGVFRSFVKEHEPALLMEDNGISIYELREKL